MCEAKVNVHQELIELLSARNQMWADRYTHAKHEIQRLRAVIAQTLGALQALHPSSASDMADADYARLWNATMEMLENA